MAIGSKPDKAAMAAEASLTTAEMEAQIEVLKAEIAKLKAQATSSGEKSFEALRTIANEGIGQARAQGEAAMQNLRDNADDIEAQLAAVVREKPVTSLAMAAGVGFLLALITRR